MLKLMKYEIQRRFQFMFIILAMIVFFEGLIIFGLYKGDLWLPLVFVFTILMFVGTYFLVFIDGVRTLYSDLNSKQGYMIFLTPTNSYKIIGSKIIITLIEMLSFVLLTVTLLIINYSIGKGLYIDTSLPQIQEIYNEIAGVMKMVFPTEVHIFLLAFTSVMQWIGEILLAMLAIILAKTIFSKSKSNWIISIVFYIVISTCTQFITAGVLSLFGFIKDIIDFSLIEQNSIVNNAIPDVSGFIGKYVAITAFIYLCYSMIFFIVSGKILNKKVDI